MFTRKPLHILLFLLIIILTACIPVAAQEPQSEPAAMMEPATPTPEVFIPLDPSPTPSDSDLPLTCQVTDLNVYIDRAAGYCFAYPMDFSLGDQPSDVPEILGPEIFGPARDTSPEPVRASLGITTHPVPGGSELTPLVDAYLTMFPNPPSPITREFLMLGGEPAEKLEPILGLGSARVVVLLHGNTLFNLTFHPTDLSSVDSDLTALYQTVTGSFAFLPTESEYASTQQSITWAEFGRNFSLSYDSLLAPWVDVQTAPSVPTSDQILFAETRPSYVQFRFFGFQGGRGYDLPLLPFDNRMAQVMIFQTADFPGFGDDHPDGFLNQLHTLQDVLANGLDPAKCAQPYGVTNTHLPFLPWINMQQVFCSQPQILQFEGGQGVRYLTYFAQSPEPALDYRITYTFQGLTDDGEFYISAEFPIATGIFPTEAPPCPKCGEADYNPFEEWAAILVEQHAQLNTLAADSFLPSLITLDDVIKSLQIEQ